MTVQGPVKEQQPDGMSHRGGGRPPDIHPWQTERQERGCSPRKCQPLPTVHRPGPCSLGPRWAPKGRVRGPCSWASAV